MADPMSGLDMVREIIGQITNLRKLVTVNGKQYKYDPKSKSYKADGKTFTPSQLKAKLEGQSFKAPKIDNKSKLKINKTTPKSTQTKTKGPKIADPWRGTYSTPKENLKINKDIKARKKGFFEKYGVTNKDIKNVERTGKKKDGTYKMSRGTKAQVNQSNYGRKNAALAILGKAADWGVDQLVDRGARQIAGKSKMTLEEFRKARDKGELKGTLKNKISGTPLKGSEELSAHRRGRQKKNQPTTSKKDIKIKSKKKDEQVSVGNMVGATATVPKKKLTPRQEWEKKTRNSPARKSGAFTADQLWEAQKRHREWKKKNKRK